MLSLTVKRDCLIVLAGTWLCLAASSWSWAQPPKGASSSSGSKESREFWSILGEASKDSNNNRFYFLRMVEHPAIQAEIELTSEELKEIDTLNHLHMDEVRKLRDDYVKAPDKEFCKQALRELLRQQDAAFMRKLRDVVNFERLLQISVQVYGSRSVTQAEIAERVGLSQEKLAEIRSLAEKVRQDEFEKMGDSIRELMRSGPQSGKKARDMFKQIDIKVNEAIRMRLTSQQLEALTQNRGSAFEIPDDLFERRRSGRGDRNREDRDQDTGKREFDNKQDGTKEHNNKERGNKEDGDKSKEGCAKSIRVFVSRHS